MPDTRIDDFLSDIAPFFKGRAICYLDVGAYIGLVYDDLMRSAIVVGDAYLIEPNPDSFAKLEERLATALKAGKLHTYNRAVSDKNTTLTLQKNRTMTRVVNAGENTESRVTHPGRERAPNSSDGELFSIESIRLDGFANRHIKKNVDLMKIDVEGHEIPALRGARKLLQRQQINVIYIEAGLDPANTQQTHIHKIDEFLRRYGYRIYRIYEQKHEWPTKSPLLRRVNVAYMSESFAAEHPVEDR